MPKKRKTTEVESANESTSNDDKFVVLRDSKNELFLVVSFNNLLTSDKAKIVTGADIAYKTKNRDGGRGTVLLIDKEEKCLSLVKLLEKKESSKSTEAAKSSTIDECEQSQDDSDDDESTQSTPTDTNINSASSSVTTSSIKVIRSRSSKPLTEKNQDLSSTTNKRTNENDDEITTSKRLKDDDQSNVYLRSRIISLQDENRKLKIKIEEMETTWMPRPDPITIEYFSKIVSICTGENNEREQNKTVKLASIMNVLAMSEEELAECTDAKSIRSTCRRLVRVVFKNELSNPNIHFRSVLQQTKIVSAIREFGRIMHPIESSKFSDGELNNAMGSDFYQRDRGLKLNKSQDKATTETGVTDDERNQE